MPQQFPSIQSFFQPERSPAKQQKTIDPPSAAGDGFTVEEVEVSLHPPALPTWQPRGHYEEVEINKLIPGPGCVALMGRIVNYYLLNTPSKAPHAAKGCLKLVVKDDTSALLVRLWYDKIDYQIRLGQLVSIWTPHVSSADSKTISAHTATLMSSIFPEKDNSCYFLVQEKSDDGTMCKLPLGYQVGKQLPGLMTLKSFIEGGHEVHDAKVLVCVKSIGGRKTFQTKKGNQAAKVEIGIFDDTADATFQLWNCVAVSSCAWKASDTILLISSPGFKGEGRPTLTIDTKTLVDIDPIMTDALWMRKFAQNLTKREHVNPPFPEGVFDIEAALNSEVRLLFTFADIDEFARAAPQERVMGWFSVILLEMNIMNLHQRGMMFCNECCGLPTYSNKTIAKCKQCDQKVQLRINPRIVGTFVDETGCIGCGKLIWSTTAWEQLLGRTAEELADCDLVVLRYLEYRLLFLRYNLFFGWSEEVGKLAICRISIS